MATITIDTYKFIENLRPSGIPEAQAKAMTRGIQEINLEHVATKEDLLELKADLFKWLVPLLLGQAGLITALIKLF